MNTARRWIDMLGLLLSLTASGSAQFDAYSWTLVFPDSPNNYVAGDTMHIECTPVGFGYCDTHYETVAPASGTFVVDVASQAISFGGGFGAFTYRNGFEQSICQTCTTTITLAVEAGDSFGFGMNANDFLIATVTYSNLVFVAAPTVQSIGKTMAFVQESVVITGKGFGPDTTVAIDGVPEPVLAWTPTTLVIAPALHAPGFFDVQVTNGGLATTVVEGGLAFLPTLAMSDPEVGGSLDIEIDSSTPGAYLLLYGLKGLPAPIPAVGAYYGLAIDPSSVFGILTAGALSGTAPVELSFTLPDESAFAGVPVHLQAWTQQGGAPGGVTASFTNRTSGVLAYPTTTTLATLAKTQPGNFDAFGATLAPLGDIDGDSVGEIAVGAPESDELAAGAGSVRVYSGASGSPLLTLLGQTASARFGSSIDGLRDSNGDAVPDLVVGASGAGVVTVHSGTDGAVLRTLIGPNVAVAGLGDLDADGVPEIGVGNGTFNTSSVVIYSGATGAILRQHTAPDSDSLGAALARTGDIDKDGTLDYIAGAPYNGCGYPDPSYARVYSGRSGAPLFTFTADSCYDLGTSVADASDVNRDGWPDVIVGAPATSGTSLLLSGFVRVYSGKDGTILHEFVGEPPVGTPPSLSPAERFGESVDGAGDVNGDGLPDLIVGIPLHGSPAPGTVPGAVRVYSGAFGTLLYEFSGVAPGAWLGDAVAGLGDLNGDGLADFAAGAPYEIVDGTFAGRVVIWSGVPLP